VLLNTAGLFDPLLAQLERAIADGFVRPEHRALFDVTDDPARAVALCRPAARRSKSRSTSSTARCARLAGGRRTPRRGGTGTGHPPATSSAQSPDANREGSCLEGSGRRFSATAPRRTGVDHRRHKRARPARRRGVRSRAAPPALGVDAQRRSPRAHLGQPLGRRRAPHRWPGRGRDVDALFYMLSVYDARRGFPRGPTR
jgi:hypothetical protein